MSDESRSVHGDVLDDIEKVLKCDLDAEAKIKIVSLLIQGARL